MSDSLPMRLELRGIRKAFPTVIANDDVDLAVAPGSIHAVLGENGAGKSTLMKIVYGVMRADAGIILWEGSPVSIASPSDARALDIGMVFQHFSLFPALSVAENIALTLRGGRDPAAIGARALDVSRHYGIPVDPARTVHTLSVEPRAEPSRAMGLATPLVAAALCVLCGSALFVFLGLEPVVVFRTFFVSSFRDLYSIGELSLKVAPLALCAVGLAIGFRANVWNIGAEGQLIVGAIAGGGLGLAFPHTASAWLLPAMLLAGALGGMAWAAIPAFLKVRFNTNEILVTLVSSRT